MAKGFLAKEDKGRKRLRPEVLPSYCPELNPAELL
ncbi:MAG: transposase [Bernardetiaceae bacterium]|nr:transposase [Bernardetiaceae bacterium]